MAILDKLPSALWASPKIKSYEETAEGLSVQLLGARNVLVKENGDGSYEVTISNYEPGGAHVRNLSSKQAKVALARLRGAFPEDVL